MRDLSAFLIPETLDEPEKILFFTYSELAVLMFPLIVGIVSEYTIRGLIIGIILLFLFKKFKLNSNYTITHIMYWYCPEWLFKLTYLPSSTIRVFI